MQEIPGEGDGYFGTTYLKDWEAIDKLFEGNFTDDSFQDGIYFEGIELYPIEDGFEWGDTVIVEVQSMGAEATYYLQDIENEIYRDAIFSGPPANVRTNIEGGALGYFILSDVRTAEIVIE